MKLSTSLLCATLLGATTLSAPTVMSQESVKLSTPIPFRGVSHLITVRRKGRGFTAKSLYPQFRMSTPVTRLANLKLRTEATKGVLDFASDSAKEFEGETTIMLPYEYDETPSLYFYAPHRLISLGIMDYSFTGGAHGNFATTGKNFGIVPGQTKPKALVLGDFFRPGSAYRTRVEKLLLDKLRVPQRNGEEATWIIDGSVKKFDTYQLNNFVAEKGGLRWFFAPYAVGPFVAGEFEVKLTTAELGPDFKKGWLLGR